MSEDNSYDLKPEPRKPKPGDPDWVAPEPIVEKAAPQPEPEPEPVVDPDVQNNKAMAILGYICFIIPLAAAPKSKFARFHANQGLMVFILWCIAIFVGIVLEVASMLLSPHMENALAIIWFFFGCIVHLVPVVLFLIAAVFTLIGIINAANGETKPLPLIGHWTPIK
jgi:uncharacterized membrane protein